MVDIGKNMEDFRKTSSFKKTKREIKQKFITSGLLKKHLDLVSDCLATSDTFGVTTHGSLSIEGHLNRLSHGGYNLHPQISVIKKTPSFALIDGDNSIGIVSAEYCTRYAIKKAKKNGVFTVFSRNNNTFGPAFYYSLLASEQGCVAIVLANSPAQMTIPFGGTEKMLGTNPFSIAFPVPDSEPIIVDMATSVVAKSKIKEYQNSGKSIPLGWALDSQGNPTTDPNEAIKGSVLPMSGIKGYGISLMIDMIAGFLSGSSYLNHVGRFYSNSNESMNVGFNITVIDPEIIYGPEYGENIKRYVDEIRNSPTNGQKIILPGDDRIDYKNNCITNSSKK